jgi:FkbM family methyltransferase
MVKQQIKRLLGNYYSPRLRHLKRRLEVRFLGKGEPELAVLPRLLDGNQLSLDIGANIGDYLNVLAQYSLRAIGFEPHPVCFAYLGAAGIANCTLVNLALSDRSGTAVLKVPVEESEVTGLATIEAANTSFTPLATRVQEYEVKVARLDDAVVDLVKDGERIGFIKIDVEGHEHAVLMGAEATIDRHRPIVLLETEYRHGAPIAEIFAMFGTRQYVAKILHAGRMQDVDPDRLQELQREVGIGDIVKDAKDSVYLNNVWFIPRERAAALGGMVATA